MPRIALTNVRPYCYLYFQKDKIEKIIKEIKDSGIIQPSISPYSYPALLIRKNNVSWRMCVDHKALNRIIVKDKCLIPIIDELLDDLGGAQQISMLDWRSGHHWIQVHEDNT